MSAHVPALQYAVIAGVLRYCGDLAHLAPAARPPAFCPECGEPVILRLGEVRAYHVAHRPGSTCGLTAPETAIHFNTKMHVARQLDGAHRVELVTDCRADHPRPVLAQAWDRIEVERRLACGLRPDVSFWRGGQMIAGIEVYVSHAVEEMKGKRLEGLGVPWVEIPGSPAFYSGRSPWHSGRPLPTRPGRGSVDLTCAICAQEVEPTPAPLPPDPLRDGLPPEPTTFKGYAEDPRPERWIPGVICVACGHGGIFYASNSGPLCKQCRYNDQVRRPADGRALKRARRAAAMQQP